MSPRVAFPKEALWCALKIFTVYAFLREKKVLKKIMVPTLLCILDKNDDNCGPVELPGSRKRDG